MLVQVITPGAAMVMAVMLSEAAMADCIATATFDIFLTVAMIKVSFLLGCSPIGGLARYHNGPVKMVAVRLRG